MKKHFVFFVLVLSHFFSVAQRVNISFNAAIDGKEHLLDSLVVKNEKDTLLINQLKFYISNIQFLKDDEIVFTELNSYHLIDFNMPASTSLFIKTFRSISYNSIRFYLGIDSLTNVSGALGGELDPTHGMYWTWQSGYINFKMEGQVSRKEEPLKEFQIHLGGYQQPFYSLQEVQLNVHDENINLELNLDPFLHSIDFSNVHHIMSPSKKAVELSEILAKNFKVKKND
ncbi:MAG: hypothetical protein KA347_08660 [Bacteroidia bacterium]|nr:hypothetical protein [Bacteroidia bacterium]MBP7244276.1 hypothetical protein [Bacteroidia bacterium]